MASARRMGPRTSVPFNDLLDAAERVLREHGYGAVSSRRVAAEAGLKQQLVYYYFRTMDELLLACFQRRTARALARLAEDSASPQPVRAIWNTLSNASDGKLSFEFMALANRHDGIRAEVASFIAQSRQIITAVIARLDGGRGAPLAPAAASFLLSAVSLMLGRETATGIDAGHIEMNALIESTLAAYD